MLKEAKLNTFSYNVKNNNVKCIFLLGSTLNSIFLFSFDQMWTNVICDM